MCNGWVKIHRKMVDWEWFSSPTTSHLLFYFILKANIEDKKWRGRVIKRGQFVTSRAVACEESGLTVQEYRTAVKRLLECGTITTETTNTSTIVTLCNYESYQQKEEPSNQPSNQRITNQQPTNNQRITNQQPQLKNNKKERIEEDKEEHSLTIVRECKKSVALATPHSQELLEQRLKKFYDSLVPYVQFYGKDFIREFYDYWSEPNKSKTKFRMELERTWSLERRLATWAKRQGEYERRTNQTSNGSKSTKAERDAEFLDHIREKLSRPDEDAVVLPWEE